MIVESFGRCFPAEGLSGAVVEPCRDGLEVARAVFREVGSFREVLSQKTIGGQSTQSRARILVATNQLRVASGRVTRRRGLAPNTLNANPTQSPSHFIERRRGNRDVR
jgi:hypothetical protein